MKLAIATVNPPPPVARKPESHSLSVMNDHLTGADDVQRTHSPAQHALGLGRGTDHVAGLVLEADHRQVQLKLLYAMWLCLHSDPKMSNMRRIFGEIKNIQSGYASVHVLNSEMPVRKPLTFKRIFGGDGVVSAGVGVALHNVHLLERFSVLFLPVLALIFSLLPIQYEDCYQRDPFQPNSDGFMLVEPGREGFPHTVTSTYPRSDRTSGTDYRSVGQHALPRSASQKD